MAGERVHVVELQKLKDAVAKKRSIELNQWLGATTPRSSNYLVQNSRTSSRIIDVYERHTLSHMSFSEHLAIERYSAVRWPWRSPVPALGLSAEQLVELAVLLSSSADCSGG